MSFTTAPRRCEIAAGCEEPELAQMPLSTWTEHIEDVALRILAEGFDRALRRKLTHPLPSAR